MERLAKPLLLRADCLLLRQKLEPGCAALAITDPPYGKTALSWDSVLSFEDLWAVLKYACKDGPWIFTAVQPFTTQLIASNLADFRYTLVWDKGKGSNPLLANRRPMQSHEDIVVFYKKQPRYNPQMTKGAPYKSPRTGGNRSNAIVGASKDREGWYQDTKDTSKRFPLSVLKFSIHCGSKLQPTQKPVELMEWLIKTYTNEGDTVLDCCMGTGTTGVAALQTKRNFIGVELNPKHFKVAKKRIEEVLCR
jgi:site-specific DNA-methyltransferase (adenine-specific)